MAPFPCDFQTTPAAVKKRLYQLMVEVAVISEKVKSDLMVRANYIDDAADLVSRLAELEVEGAEEPDSA